MFRIVDQNADEGRRVALSDGTELTYWLRGRSEPEAPAMVLTNGLTTSIQFWRNLLPRWTRTHRVLLWDLPGHGASSPARSQQMASLAAMPDAIATLMDAAGIERAVQIGWSTGCQVVLEMYRRHSARCVALVLLIGSAGRVLSTAALPLPGTAIDWLVRRTPRPLFAGASHVLARIAHAPGGLWLTRGLGLIGEGTTRDEAATITEHLLHIDHGTVQTMIASAQAHDAWDVLPTLALPTLIVTGDLDPFAPAATVGVDMQARAPGAAFLRLPRGSHTALFDHAEEISDAVDDILRSRAPEPWSPSGAS